ncbi:asparaginase [Methylobacterium marchantiae]|uniref:Asparaginase n=1 Tax=Methylobacterium marchantiae TaxID=600331 RepID=A0ABW3WSD9_9HYPH|nr:putative L-asparaginase [Methylobacterium marchantiae]
MAGMSLPTVAVVATGGTIAMKVDPVTHAPVPALSGADLVAAAPGLEGLARIAVTEFSNIPSAEMGPDLWPSLTRAVEGLLGDADVAGAVILHGTDTLDTTAFFLDLTLRSDKPVVVIGAQRNASDPDSDGARNLLNAVRQILTPGAASLGVTVTLNHAINAAREVRKTHTNNVETFRSGETGYLGTIDEDRVVLRRAPLRRQTLPLPDRLARVDIVGMYAGADGSQIRHAAETGAEGIVVAALGMGNVNAALLAAIESVIARGVSVVIATKLENGRALPVYGFPGGGSTLKTAGAVFADDLTPDKARVLAQLALPITRDRDALQAYFDR